MKVIDFQIQCLTSEESPMGWFKAKLISSRNYLIFNQSVKYSKDNYSKKLHLVFDHSKNKFTQKCPGELAAGNKWIFHFTENIVNSIGMAI